MILVFDNLPCFFTYLMNSLDSSLLMLGFLSFFFFFPKLVSNLPLRAEFATFGLM